MVSDISVWFQFLHLFTQESSYLLNFPSMHNMLQNIETSSKLSMLGLTGTFSQVHQSLSLPTLARYNCFPFILNWWIRMSKESRKSFRDQSLLMFFSMPQLLLLAISQLTVRLLRLFSTEALLLVAETMLLWLHNFLSSWFYLLQFQSITILSETRSSTCSSKRRHSLKRSN